MCLLRSAACAPVVLALRRQDAGANIREANGQEGERQGWREFCSCTGVYAPLAALTRHIHVTRPAGRRSLPRT
jgi:hypothetical protein